MTTIKQGGPKERTLFLMLEAAERAMAHEVATAIGRGAMAA